MLTEPEGKGLAAKKKGRCQKHGQSLTCLLNGIWSPKPRLCSDDQLETQSLLWEFLKKNIYIWLVVEPTPQKNMSSSVGMMTFPTEWKNKGHVPNHQPVFSEESMATCSNCLFPLDAVDRRHFPSTIWIARTIEIIRRLQCPTECQMRSTQEKTKW